LAHLHIICALFLQTYDLLQSLLNLALEHAWAFDLTSGVTFRRTRLAEGRTSNLIVK